MANNNFEFNELIDFKNTSYDLGNNFQLVQAAGGNTSIKSENTMLIKASGTWLINSKKDDIFVELDLASIKNKIKMSKEDNFVEDIMSNNNLRPSTETSFHGLINFKYVLHAHSTTTIANSIFHESKNLLKEKLGEHIVYVPYIRPGFPLTMLMKNLIKNDTRIIILENHGLIVAGDNLNDTYNLLLETHNKLDNVINQYDIDINVDKVLTIPQYIQKNHNKYQIFKTKNEKLLSVFSKSFYPDHVIFLGPGIPLLNSPDDAKKFILEISKKNFKLPPYIIIKNYGLYENIEAIPAAKEMLDCFIEILLRIDFNYTPKTLSKEQENELLNWDAEIYRQTIN